jgi:hypothetical protein
MSKTYITIANADRQYSPATMSNDMLLFAGSVDQRVVIGVGANGTTTTFPLNYLSIGSNDTIIGNDLVVYGTIKDSTGAIYGIGGGGGTGTPPPPPPQTPYTPLCIKYAQTTPQTVPANTWTIVTNFTNVFAIGSGITYSAGGFYTNDSGKTLTLSVSYTLVGFNTAASSGTRVAQIRVFSETGAFLHKHAIDVRSVITETRTGSEGSAGSGNEGQDTTINTILLPTSTNTNIDSTTTITTDTILFQSNTTVSPTKILVANAITLPQTGDLDDSTLNADTIVFPASTSTTADSTSMTSADTVLLTSGTITDAGADAGVQPTTPDNTLVIPNTLVLQSTQGLETYLQDPTTLAGSMFIQLAPNFKLALYGHATAIYTIDESTVNILEIACP